MTTTRDHRSTAGATAPHSSSFAQKLIETLNNGATDEKLRILALFENQRSELELYVSLETLFENLLSDPAVEVRIAVVREIEKLLLVNDDYAYLLGVALADDDTSVKAQALGVLKQHCSAAPKIFPSLLGVLKHTESMFRVVALNIIATSGSQGSWLLPAVVRCTRDTNARVVKAAYNALINIAGKADLQQVMGQAKDSHSHSEKLNQVLENEVFCV